jgi:hypothetical protein
MTTNKKNYLKNKKYKLSCLYYPITHIVLDIHPCVCIAPLDKALMLLVHPLLQNLPNTLHRKYDRNAPIQLGLQSPNLYFTPIKKSIIIFNFNIKLEEPIII